jgi:hypothetical protein
MGNLLPLAAMAISSFWYALPLVVVVSLVYAATRHEDVRPILEHSVRIGVWIVGFMTCVFVVLVLMNWWVSHSA